MGVKPHSEEIRTPLLFAAREGRPVPAGANGNGISSPPACAWLRGERFSGGRPGVVADDP